MIPRVGDYDVFRYGGDYWVFSDGYWYRCARWRGPFRVVEPRYVPASFYRLPPAHWNHHPNVPPGQMMRGDNPPGHMQGGPPGQAKKGEKDDKGGGRGKK